MITYEIFRDKIFSLIKYTSIKTLILGYFRKTRGLYDLDEIIKANSIILRQELIHNNNDTKSENASFSIFKNKNLDDSYIFSKEIYEIYINKNAILNMYQYGSFSEKNYVTIILLETMLNQQFSRDDYSFFEGILDFENIEHGVYISEGNILVIIKYLKHYKIKLFSTIKSLQL